MSIQIFPNSPAGEALALAVPDPKHVWYDMQRIVVYTGSDIPADPPKTGIPIEEFRNSFTQAELAAIAASNDLLVRTAILKITTRDDRMVPINDETRAVLAHMVSIGLLADGRPAQLLT